jgi:xylan 1,4-beta-xylosidase
MNKLGETELQNKDTSSWAAKNAKGDVQLLFWDFTNTHPGDSVNGIKHIMFRIYRLSQKER